MVEKLQQAELIGTLDLKSKESLGAIVQLFNLIDSQILELHRCSSEDFLGLNSKFKAFYKDAKAISISAGSLFQLFSTGANRKLTGDLEAFQANLDQCHTQLGRLLDSILHRVHSLRRHLTAIYLPLRNIAQNSSTLNLLLANLTLGRDGLPDRVGYPPETFAALRSEVELFINLILSTGRQAQGYAHRLEQEERAIQQVRNHCLRGIEHVESSVRYGLLLFAEKHRESDALIPEITRKTESTSKSIAGIITNLQYQDIIRQKMEHIQTAHHELMDNLTAVARADDDTEKARIDALVQIRDISSLQSAQLVATNREYQQAIEMLAQHFRSISRDMEEIASLSRDSLRARPGDTATTAMSELLGRLQHSREVLASLADDVPSLRETLTAIAETNEAITEDLVLRHIEFGQIRSLGLPLLQLSEATQQREGCADLLTQLKSVMADLDTYGDIVYENALHMQRHGVELANFQAQLQDELPLWNSLAEGANRMHGIAAALARTEQESASLLSEIEARSLRVETDTKNALREIRYYDFFEEAIEEIVDILNRIAARVREVVHVEESADLESVRQRYTMASERRVHEAHTMGAVGDVDLFGEEMPEVATAGEDDDGLELF